MTMTVTLEEDAEEAVAEEVVALVWVTVRREMCRTIRKSNCNLLKLRQ